jgi:very-short-patch-repair endonuclease
LADHRLHRLFRGAYAVGSLRVTQRGRWKAATLSVGPDALIAATDAAALTDLIRRPRGPIDLLVPERRARSQEGIRMHSTRSLHPDDRSEIDGIPVTSLARTLLDLAEVLTPLELQRAYERAEELEILDTTAVAALLARSNGRRGVAAVRSLLSYDPTAAASAESELERLFLDLIRDAGLPEPQVGVLVDGFLVDAIWPEANLVVELDGFEFHRDRETFERDRMKAAELRLAGRTVVAFTYRQVTEDEDWVLTTVRRLLGRAGALSAASS